MKPPSYSDSLRNIFDAIGIIDIAWWIEILLF